MGWLGKMFSGDDKPAEPPESAPDEAGEHEVASAEEVDAEFYRWLAAPGPAGATEASERQVLDELAGLSRAPVAGAALVPRVPAIISQLMRSLLDENMNARELSRQLSQDVVLVAEVFREANRPCYRPRYHASADVDTIEGAIMLLGQEGMRMLLARVALRPVISMQTGGIAKRTAPLVWRQAEKCALAASLLAPAVRANAFEAYLAGLLSNVGLVVAFRLIDQICPEDALPQSDGFIEKLFAESRILSARIAELWEFPAEVASAIEHSGEPDGTALEQALALGDRVSKLRMLVDAIRFDPDAPFVVNGLSPAALACLGKLGDND